MLSGQLFAAEHLAQSHSQRTASRPMTGHCTAPSFFTTRNKALTHNCAGPVVSTVSSQPSRSLTVRVVDMKPGNCVGVQTPALGELRQTDTSDCASCPSVTLASDALRQAA